MGGWGVGVGGGGGGGVAHYPPPYSEYQKLLCLHKQLGQIIKGEVNISYSRMTKTCWDTLVTCL